MSQDERISVIYNHISSFNPLSNQHQHAGTNVKVCTKKIAFFCYFFGSKPRGLTLSFVQSCDIFAEAD
jgi:hypothetical protein